MERTNRTTAKIESFKKKKQTNDVQDIVYYTHKLVLQKYSQTYRPARMITKRKRIEYHSIARWYYFKVIFRYRKSKYEHNLINI
jgi:hypothetical protein